jgi:MYXO-CTERM domain-containing protein
MRRLLPLLLASSVWAHGGPPVSIGLIRDSNTMYIPVFYWGVWVGQDNGPWKWICEEEINQDRFRKYARTGDGTLIVTDTHGLTISTNGGCTWTPLTGALAALRASDIAGDPVDGSTAWVTTDQASNSPDAGTSGNALWVTHDRASTFTAVPGLDGSGRRFESVKVGSGVMYVVSTSLTTPFNVTLNRSADGGASFVARPVSFTVGGVAPYSAEIMALDPRSADGLYLRVFVSVPGDGGDPVPLQVLLRSSDGGTSWSEVYRVVGEINPSSGATHGIDGVAVDAKRGKVFIATVSGLMAGADPGGAATISLSPTGGLSVTQCVEIHNDAIYVCGNNYPPDLKALARSDDGGQTFVSVLSYQDTVGAVDCPADTPVAQMCPYYWDTYSAQLGINTGIDGSTTTGGGEQGPGCSCAVGERGAPVIAIALPLLLLAYLLLYRRRRRS